MKKIIPLFVLLLSVLATFSQTVTLTFTGRDANNQHIHFNRVVIANVTQGWQETIYYPDTVFTMSVTGIADQVVRGDFGFRQNNPNPFSGTTYATLQTTDVGEAILELLDVNGRVVETWCDASLQSGMHKFRINVVTAGFYFLIARQNGQTSSLKMVNNGQGATNRIEYQNFADTRNNTKDNANNNAKGVAIHSFALGDLMEYVGYATINGVEVESEHIMQEQSASQIITLQFGFAVPVGGQPCLSTPTVTDYDNNTYNTVQIGQQCWMKENLRTTKYADGTTIPMGSTWSYDVAYRYYPNDNSSNVNTYGYLYNWKAVMRNPSSSTSNPSGVQGVCPNGWHVPSDAEWTQLENYVSSRSEYVCGSNNTYIAKALVSATGWESNSNNCVPGNNPSANNATGFSAVPAGFYYGYSFNFGSSAAFWSATRDGSLYAYLRCLYFYDAIVYRVCNTKDNGFSVRCLRDDGSSPTLPTVTTTSVTSITQNSATSGGNVTADGGSTVTARGVCWSMSQSPTISNCHTTNSSVTVSFSSSITGLSPNTTYYVRAYATNSVGTAYGNQVSFITRANLDGQPCFGEATVTDYDNNTYNTVRIGNQCWMKENLKTTHYADGTPISLGSSTSTTTAYRYYPDNNTSNVSTYGYLYNWKAVMGNSTSSEANPSRVQGICPTGWHVPSDAEWTQLTYYVSTQSEYVCGSNDAYIAKALASATGWHSNTHTCAVGNNPSGNDATGFSAVPAGYYSGRYYYFGDHAYFWSATLSDSGYAFYRYLYSFIPSVTRNCNPRNHGFSVRCLRN